MKRLILCLSLLATPGLAREPVCTMNGAASLSVPGQAKAVFLAGRYDDFHENAASLATNREGRMTQMMGPLQNLFPKGFDGCEVVMQRRDICGLVQEVSLFKVPEPRSGYLSLLLTMARLDGQRRLGYVSYNDQIAQVLEGIG